MKKFLLTMALLMFSFNAMALDVNTNGLSEEQKAQLLLQAAQMKTATNVTPQKAKEWAEVSQAITVGIVASATELGMSVDKLMSTTTGKLVIAGIIYKVVGKDLLGIAFGLLWLFIAIPIWVYFWATRGSRYLYSYEKFEKGKREDGKTVVKDYRDTSPELKFMYAIALMMVTAVGLVSIFA